MSLFGSIYGYYNTGRAANALGSGYMDAMSGVLQAARDAQAGVRGAVNQANVAVPQAGQTAIGMVNDATGAANSTLQGYLDSIGGALNPYMTAGTQGIQGLSEYAASKPQFNFTLNDWQNDPGYQFQMDQGTRAIQNTNAARGLGNSGAALKELTQYGQGLAGTYYQQAFQRAKDTFNTNQNATLANLGMLIDSGMQGTNLYSQATQNLGGRQGQNLMTAGLYGGETTTNLAQYLAGLNLRGAESSGQFGMTGAKQAGDYRVGAAGARSAGIIGQGAALTQGVSDLGSLLQNLGVLKGGWGKVAGAVLGGGK